MSTKCRRTCVNNHVLMFLHKKSTSKHMFAVFAPLNLILTFTPPLHYNGEGSKPTLNCSNFRTQLQWYLHINHNTQVYYPMLSTYNIRHTDLLYDGSGNPRFRQATRASLSSHPCPHTAPKAPLKHTYTVPEKTSSPLSVK